MLLLDAGRYHLNALAIDPVRKEALAASNFEMDENAYGSLADLCSQHSIFKPYYQKVAVVYNVAESIITPPSYHEVSERTLELVYGDLQRSDVISEPVHNIPAQNIYRVEDHIREAITLQFQVQQYYHIYSVLLRKYTPPQNEAVIKVVVYSRHMIVLAYKNAKLQLAQHFPLDAAEDVSYSLVKVCNDLGMPPAGVQVIVAGWVNTQSAVYLEIMKYFLNVEFEAADNTLSFDEVFADTPMHFFSPLINLASCVS